MNRTLEEIFGKDNLSHLESLYQAKDTDLYKGVLADVVEQNPWYKSAREAEVALDNYSVIRPKDRIQARIQDELYNIVKNEQ